MGFRLVRGEFHLFYKKTRHEGSEPDGDTVWFKPNNLKLLENFSLADEIPARTAKVNGGGLVNLRFEGIDALELHYEGGQQQDAGARAARDFTLQRLGFQQVTYSGQELKSVRSAQPHPRKGYILTRTIDPFSRPVAFIFAGETNIADGKEVFLDVPHMDKSVNAQLAKAGFAYPGYYKTIPTDLRNRLTQLADEAYYASPRRGVWAEDVTMKGAVCNNLQQLQTHVLWPKLFRRLTGYFKKHPQGLSQFDAWLRADKRKDDEVWIASEATAGNLHDVIHISGNKISLKYWPEDLILTPQ